jgi:hypothetical protein
MNHKELAMNSLFGQDVTFFVQRKSILLTKALILLFGIIWRIYANVNANLFSPTFPTHNSMTRSTEREIPLLSRFHTWPRCSITKLRNLPQSARNISLSSQRVSQAKRIQHVDILLPKSSHDSKSRMRIEIYMESTTHSVPRA